MPKPIDLSAYGIPTDAEEFYYLLDVLVHLGELIDRTPKDQPLFKAAQDVNDTLAPLLGYFSSDLPFEKKPPT